MLRPNGQPCHQILISLYSLNGCISSQIRVKTIINFKLPDWKYGCSRWILVVQRNQAFGIIGPGGTIYITHRGQMTHKHSKLTIIGSDNGLSPGRCQAIIRTNAWILLIWPYGTNFSEILIEIQHFHRRKCVGKCLLKNGSQFVSASTLFSSIHLWFILYFVFVELALCAYATQRHSSSCSVVTSGTS